MARSGTKKATGYKPKEKLEITREMLLHDILAIAKRQKKLSQIQRSISHCCDKLHADLEKFIGQK